MHQSTRKQLPTISRTVCILFLLLVNGTAVAQITLLGDNAPFSNVNDGNFSLVDADSWRHGLQSPFWTPSMEPQKEGHSMGLVQGKYFSSFDYAYIDSKHTSNND